MSERSRKISHEDSPTDSISASLYGFRWQEYFPLNIGEDEEVRLVSFEEAYAFIRSNHENIFEDSVWGNPFYQEVDKAAKHRYYRKLADSFLYFKKGIPFAVTIGTPIDWSSYYLRYGAFLKDYQGGGRAQKFMTHLISVLTKNSVGRLEIDISPSNLVNLHVFNKLKFNISGLVLSERWGALIHLTKILNTSAEKVFLDQFCSGIRPQLEPEQGVQGLLSLRSSIERGKP